MMADYIERSYIRKMAMLEPRYTMQTRYDSDLTLKLIAEAPAADMTREQECIAELYRILERLENDARNHDLTIMRTSVGASPCDQYQGLPLISRVKDHIYKKYEDVICAALNTKD